MENRETIIDLKKYFYELLRRAIPILLCTLLCGALGVGYATMQNKKAYAVEMPMAQKEEVDRIFSQYKNRVIIRDNLNSYLYNSTFMQLDAEDLPTMSVQYQIESSRQSVKDTLWEMVLTPEIKDELIKIYGFKEDTAKRDIGNFIQFKDSGNSSTEMSTDLVPLEIGDRLNNQFEFVLTIRAIGEEEKVCREAIKVIEKAIEDAGEKYAATDAGFLLSKIDEQYEREYNEIVRQAQKNYLKELSQMNIEINEFSTKTNNVLTMLSESQKSYFERLVADYTNGGDGEVASSISAGKSIKKFGILSMMAGFFLSVLCVMMLYLFKDTVKSAATYQEQYSTLSDMVLCGKKPNALQKLLKARQTSDMEVRMETEKTVQTIAKIAKNHGWSSVFMATTGLSEESKEVFDSLCLAMNAVEGLSMMEGDPVKEIADHKAMLASDAVVLNIEADRTSQKAMDRLIEICKDADIPIAGCVYETVI
ncbi:MAG: hypothetical protein J5935_06040 [Lachnospiraceae bacterium]|nr:hypothetical protein [Lachnospiraceae bacterium]